MSFLRNAPLRTKLTYTTMLAAGVALLLVGAAVIAYEFVMYRSLITRELTSLADVIGASSRAALVFKDPNAAADVLQALRADPRIVAAATYRTDGVVFATYRREDGEGRIIPESAQGDGTALQGRDLILFRSLLLEGKRIGTIFIRSDLQEMYTRLWQHLIIVAVVLGVSSMVALLLSSALHKVIAEPVMHLVETARTVSDTRDYSIRAVRSGQDELGLLIDNFNEMLTLIHQRDLALRQAQEELEKRVKMRTSQLELEVAEHCRTQEALKQLSSAVEQAGDSVVITDREGCIEYVNPAFEMLTGYTLQETRGRTSRILKSGLHETEFYRQLWQTLLSGQVFRAVLINRKKDGTCYYEDKTITPLRDGSGQITHFVSAGRDITQRMRAEAALKESEEKYRTLIEVSQDAIFINYQNQIVYMNPALVKLLGGETAEQLIGRSPFDFIHPQYHEVVRDRIQAVLDQGTPAPLLEEQYVRLDGTVIDVEVAATPLTYKDGRAIQVVVRDITERKRAEEELRSSREQLRALAAHLESIREEERSGIAREVHDQLGQMLTGLKIDLAWVTARLPPDQSALRERTREMEALIDTIIRSVRRISAQLRPGMLDDLGLVAAVAWQAQEFQARMGIDCEFVSPVDEYELDPTVATVMFRILQEALTNVVRHAEATCVTIRLAEEGERLILRITDNGRGITEQELNDRRSLGLLGMRERAMLLGGQVAVIGHPGAGTTVWVAMPFKRPVS